MSEEETRLITFEDPAFGNEPVYVPLWPTRLLAVLSVVVAAPGVSCAIAVSQPSAVANDGVS